jgi:hypothetical protein
MSTHRFLIARTALALACATAAAAANAAPTCYANYGAIESKKPNKLFLYFPTTDDPTFPNYAALTSPARTFDIALLPNPPASGTTAQLRDRIYDVVATDYCEFNVHVQSPTTGNPDALVSPPARRNMVAIGSDANGDASGVLFGQAQAVDIGDAAVVDHSRVWGGSYGVFCGTPGGTLDGANNTLDRWALGIGGTAAHEAGHNYGLSHSTTLHTGEDGILNHIMPAGGNIPCSDRVGHLRHFSDQDYGILANNVGLTVQSLANWDFVNPNASSADALQMEVLSLSSALTPAWWYFGPGSRSPWNKPIVTGPLGTKVFKGTVYNRFLVTWSTPEAWTSATPGNLPGVVRGGEAFHVGASFVEEDILNTTTQVVISDATLLRAGSPLPLNPRVPTFNTGTLAPDGSYSFVLANLVAANLVLRNLQAYVLPRQLDIQSMIFNKAGQIDFFDVSGDPVVPWRQVQLPGAVELPPGSPERPGEAVFSLGNLFKDGHNVRVKTNPTANDAVGVAEVNRAVSGALLSDPFPGASVFITGDVVEPGAMQWDPEQKQFVSKDLVTSMFLQIAGKRAKPVDGILIGLLRSKVTCSNLNSRRAVSAAVDANGNFDCEKSGLVMLHGDRVQVTQVGIAGSSLPAVQMGGLDVGKFVCTNLNTRRSVSFVPSASTARLDCAKAGLAIELNQTIEFTQVGTVR